MSYKLLFVGFFLVLLCAKDLSYNPDEARNLLLRNSFNDNLERIIYFNDMLLIDVSGDLKHYAGTFLGIQDNFIFINKKSILGNSIIAIDINEIDAIYLGIGKTFKQLRHKWGLGFAIALLPASVQMAYEGEEHPVISRPVGAFITWSFFGSVGGLFYGSIFGGLDYMIRKVRAQKFIIDSNGWFIDNY